MICNECKHRLPGYSKDASVCTSKEVELAYLFKDDPPDPVYCRVESFEYKYPITACYKGKYFEQATRGDKIRNYIRSLFSEKAGKLYGTISILFAVVFILNTILKNTPVLIALNIIYVVYAIYMIRRLK